MFGYLQDHPPLLLKLEIAGGAALVLLAALLVLWRRELARLRKEKLPDTVAPSAYSGIAFASANEKMKDGTRTLTRYLKIGKMVLVLMASLTLTILLMGMALVTFRDTPDILKQEGTWYMLGFLCVGIYGVYFSAREIGYLLRR